METVLGLLGMAVFIACVVTLAAAVTWLVVKVSPNPEDKRARAQQQQQEQPEA